MLNRWSRREVLAAGVGLGLSGGAGLAAAASPAEAVRHAWVGYAPLDPRLQGVAAGDAFVSDIVSHVPVFTSLLRRVPTGTGPIRRVEVLGASAARGGLQSLRVECVQEHAGRTRRQMVLAADETGCCAASAFACRPSGATLIVGFRGVERGVALARRGVYAIAIDRRPGLFSGLRVASFAAGDGFVLRVLEGDRVARESFLLIRVV